MRPEPGFHATASSGDSRIQQADRRRATLGEGVRVDHAARCATPSVTLSASPPRRSSRSGTAPLRSSASIRGYSTKRSSTCTRSTPIAVNPPALEHAEAAPDRSSARSRPDRRRRPPGRRAALLGRRGSSTRRARWPRRHPQRRTVPSSSYAPSTWVTGRGRAGTSGRPARPRRGGDHAEPALRSGHPAERHGTASTPSRAVSVGDSMNTM